MPLWHPWAEFFKGKNKMAADISRSNIIFQMKPGTSVGETGANWDTIIIYHHGADDTKVRNSKQLIIQPRFNICYCHKDL